MKESPVTGMVVVLGEGCHPSHLDAVRGVLDERCLRSDTSRGAGRHLVRVDASEIEEASYHRVLDQLGVMAGVERILPVTSPYPLVASDGPRSSVSVCGTSIGPDTFTLIAGPCAVEEPEQATMAWEAAVKAGATMLRGDVFKHRTSPYSFLGLGAEGLELLREVRHRQGLPLVIEVMDPTQVELAASVADVLRVGARNMQNIDLLRACGQSERPVMLKRGLAATIEEWLLAAEWIAASGNLAIILCERGIRTFEPSTRNTLDLSAVAVAQRRSHLPVIVDPSHATGSTELVAPLAMAAVAAGADGVMVDVHPRPRFALCDGAQALLADDVVQLGQDLLGLATWLGRGPSRATDPAGEAGDQQRRSPRADSAPAA